MLGVQKATRKTKTTRKKCRKKVWFILPALYSEFPVYKVKNLIIDGDPALGVCLTPPDGHRIEIRSDLSPEQRRVVLWHEAFHAIFHAAGMEANFDDEALIEMLAQAVMRIRVQVPWL